MNEITQPTSLLTALKIPVWNEIAKAVNKTNGTKTGTNSAFSSGFIPGVVTSSQFGTASIAQWAVVGLVEALGVSESMGPSESIRPMFTCAVWTDNYPERAFGILLDKLDPGGVARVMLSGVTSCVLAAYTEGDQYAYPTADGLKSTSKITSTKILWGSDTVLENGGFLAVVEMNAASTISAGIPCQTTGGNSLEGYEVNLYANGIKNPISGTGILTLVEVSAASDLPVGSWVIGFPHNTVVTGGNE